MPGARCTRGLVRKEEVGCAHEHTGSAEASGIPCVMVLRLMPRSPRRRIRLVTVVGGFSDCSNPVGLNSSPPTWHQQRVSGPHGFAVRSKRRSSLRAAASLTRFNPPCDPWRADALASTTSHPAFVTIAIRPSCRNGIAEPKPLIWGRCEAQSCPSCHCAATRRATGLSPVIPVRADARPGMTAFPHSHRHCERKRSNPWRNKRRHGLLRRYRSSQ